MLALFLLCSLVFTGGCVTVTVDNGPTRDLFPTEAQDNGQYGTSYESVTIPVVTLPSQQTSEEATLPEEVTQEEFIIDWENMEFKQQDPNVLTEEEFEAMAEQNPQMADLVEFIGPYIDFFGFAYDAEQDIFYSTKYPVQRIFGYNTLYDTGAHRFGMYFQTKRVRFTVGGKEWMVQIWKGQYGATVGGEIGVYYRDASTFIRHFEAVEDEDMVMMGFQLYKNNEPYFQRGPEEHWWLTGFRILDVAVPTQLSMVAYFDWETQPLADGFEQGLKEVLISDIKYKRDGTQFWLTWTL